MHKQGGLHNGREAYEVLPLRKEEGGGGGKSFSHAEGGGRGGGTKLNYYPVYCHPGTSMYDTFNPLDPTNLPFIMWYFPRISPNSLGIPPNI